MDALESGMVYPEMATQLLCSLIIAFKPTMQVCYIIQIDPCPSLVQYYYGTNNCVVCQLDSLYEDFWGKKILQIIDVQFMYCACFFTLSLMRLFCV